MNTHTEKTMENKSQAVANSLPKLHSNSESAFQFVDNRPEAIAQRKLQEAINNSPRVSQLKALQSLANNSPQTKQAAQLQAMADNYSAQHQPPIKKKENNTGLPDNLKIGMENLSGVSLDDVKVHRNSDKPAQLLAHAYAQGTDIHLGSGQEKHLPHEAWHVVQQKQGRVKPTIQMKGNVNDDSGLEKEADVMGIKALQMNKKFESSFISSALPAENHNILAATSEQSIQLKRIPGPEESPNSKDRRFIDKYLGKNTYREYANREYDTNRTRATKVVKQIVEALNSKNKTKESVAEIQTPNPKDWIVSPAINKAKIQKFGISISLTHNSLQHDKETKVGYTSTIKRNVEGKIELVANDNRGPKEEDRRNSEDPFIKMNLNQIWAYQIGYYLWLEQSLSKSKETGSPKMGQVKRSTIENPSTLATLWITTNAGIGQVTDMEDWLALSGSPNGSAVLYLILQTPELGEKLDFETVSKDPTSMYNLEVIDGPSFIFN